MEGRSIRVTDLVTMAFLMSMEIILTRYLSIDTGIVRIGFGFLPVAVMGILYGPLWAGVCYAAGDVLGMLLLAKAPYFPGFTLTAFLTGILYGLVLYGKPVTWKRALAAALPVCILMNLCLDTLWLQIITGQGLWALLPGRLLKAGIMIPVQTLLITLIWQRILTRIPADVFRNGRRNTRSPLTKRTK